MIYLHMSYPTAVSYLKTIFSNASNDEISLEEAYRAAMLNPETEKNNRAWIGNKLTFFKKHKLAEPSYDKVGNNRVLKAIRLTELGKKVINEPAVSLENEVTIERSSHTTEHEAQTIDKTISLIEIADLVYELNRRSQGNEFRMDIKLKEGIVSVRMGRD